MKRLTLILGVPGAFSVGLCAVMTILYVGEVSVGHGMRTIWPSYGALIVALMIVKYVPAFPLWLPQTLVCMPH